jgi:hypothetical protein
MQIINEGIFVLFQDFLPYVDRCVKRIFPPTKQTLVTSDAKFVLDLSKVHDQVPLKDLVLVKPRAATVANLEPDAGANEEVAYVVDRVSVIAQEIEESQNESTHEETDEVNEMKATAEPDNDEIVDETNLEG